MNAQAALIDLDGVIYEGERAVAGASDALAWLRERRVPHLFLTNTTSRPRRAIVEKLKYLGIRVDEEHLLTPPVAAVDWIERNAPGPVALFVPEATAPLEASPSDSAAPGHQEGSPTDSKSQFTAPG